MKLLELLKSVDYMSITNAKDIEINNVQINSDQVSFGDMFICLNGKKCSGDNFVQYAINAGCVCVVSEKECYLKDVTFIQVKNTRKALSQIAKSFYGGYSDKMNFIFVCGTNGKSTTAYLIHEIFKRSNIKSALIGSMYIEHLNKKENAKLTTPDPLDLHKLIKEFYSEDIGWVVMEVSAHAMDLYKTYSISPKIRIFTNFSQDHLDYFNTMQNYRECKKNFFMQNSGSIDIVNVDDNLGIEIANESKNKIITYGIDNPSDIFCVNIEYKNEKLSYVLNLFDKILNIKTNLFGTFNVYNSLAAMCAAYIAKVSENSLQKAIEFIPPPKGRFNIFFAEKIKYIVDFAHTPDGLINLLREVRCISQNRVITIFGCGGDRDASKRPIMGKIAKSMSDIVIITSDNPRCENANEIIEDILSAIKDKNNIYVIENRKNAIEFSKSIAKDGDVVVLAGKGSEEYMEINNKKLPYSDIEEVKKIIAKY